MPIPTSWLAAVPPLALADALSRREQDGRPLLAAGKHDAEIAATLGIQPGSVELHVSRIRHKLDADSAHMPSSKRSRWG